MTITLEFDDGKKRIFNVMDSLNQEIEDGLVATVEFMHPKHAEYFTIEIKKNIDKPLG